MGEIAINPIHNVHKKYRDMNLVNPYIFGSSLPVFSSMWNTVNTSGGSSSSAQVKLPLIASGTYNFTVDWGDGNSNVITVYNASTVTHTYTTSGIYNIKITGICIGWQFNGTGDRLKITSISSWGSLKLGTTQGGYFQGCQNLNLSSVTDILDLTGTTSLLNCFAVSFVPNINRINEWNVSGVTNMRAVFYQSSFNQDISAWNVSSVTTMIYMFYQGFFNQNIGGWNVSNVTDMQQMFFGTDTFNQNIGSWNVSKVTNFSDFMGTKTPATFSSSNLDAIYNGWSSRPVLASKNISFGTAKRTSASTAARSILTSAPNNWTITDGGI